MREIARLLCSALFLIIVNSGCASIRRWTAGTDVVVDMSPELRMSTELAIELDEQSIAEGVAFAGVSEVHFEPLLGFRLSPRRLSGNELLQISRQIDYRADKLRRLSAELRGAAPESNILLADVKMRGPEIVEMLGYLQDKGSWVEQSREQVIRGVLENALSGAQISNAPSIEIASDPFVSLIDAVKSANAGRPENLYVMLKLVREEAEIATSKEQQDAATRFIKWCSRGLTKRLTVRVVAINRSDSQIAVKTVAVVEHETKTLLARIVSVEGETTFHRNQGFVPLAPKQPTELVFEVDSPPWPTPPEELGLQLETASENGLLRMRVSQRNLTVSSRPGPRSVSEAEGRRGD